MAENQSVKSHPAWEDWLGFGLGVLVILSPYLAGRPVQILTPYLNPADNTVQLATTAIGLLILFFAFLERMQILESAKEPSREWEEVLEAALGALLFALPFILGYAGSGTLRYWHFALGAIVFLLAIFELRRDYVGEVTRHQG